MPSAVRARAGSLLLVVVLWTGVAWPIGATVPTARPEDIGRSSERLRRITELIQRDHHSQPSDAYVRSNERPISNRESGWRRVMIKAVGTPHEKWRAAMIEKGWT